MSYVNLKYTNTPLQDIANMLYNRDITNYDPRNFIKSELPHYSTI